LKQGDALSPLLFNFAVVYAIMKIFRHQKRRGKPGICSPILDLRKKSKLKKNEIYKLLISKTKLFLSIANLYLNIETSSSGDIRKNIF
jgi:hypothetical protein